MSERRAYSGADQLQRSGGFCFRFRFKIQLLELAQQWQYVAKTYEFVASLERFLIDQKNHTLPKEVEKLPRDGPPIEKPRLERGAPAEAAALYFGIGSSI